MPHGLAQVCSSLWAHADPVEPCWQGQRAVGLDGDTKAFGMQGIDECGIHVKGGLAPRQHHEAVLRYLPRRQPRCDLPTRRHPQTCPPPHTVGADEIRIAEAALGPPPDPLRAHDQRLQPAKRQNTAGVPAFAPSPCSV